MLQAVVNSKSLGSKDSRVAIPLQIVNFLSLDPPPKFAQYPISETSVLNSSASRPK